MHKNWMQSMPSKMTIYKKPTMTESYSKTNYKLTTSITWLATPSYITSIHSNTYTHTHTHTHTYTHIYTFTRTHTHIHTHLSFVLYLTFSLPSTFTFLPFFFHSFPSLPFYIVMYIISNTFLQPIFSPFLKKQFSHYYNIKLRYLYNCIIYY